ncbi:hypothetical protein D5086_033583 [Populus alba]|uniref:Uncharacterized protein n=1 Tax=Populus alba TaxID=43335 RepID=A0ACC4AI42_POPAL
MKEMEVVGGERAGLKEKKEMNEADSGGHVEQFCRVDDKDKKLRRGEEGLMNSDFCVITPFLKLIEVFSRGNPSFQYDLSFFRVSGRSITTMETFCSVWSFSLKLGK